MFCEKRILRSDHDDEKLPGASKDEKEALKLIVQPHQSSDLATALAASVNGALCTHHDSDMPTSILAAAWAWEQGTLQQAYEA